MHAFKRQETQAWAPKWSKKDGGSEGKSSGTGSPKKRSTSSSLSSRKEKSFPKIERNFTIKEEAKENEPLRITASYPRQWLKITIHCAEKLRSADDDGKSDPFTVIKIGDQPTIHSTVCMSTLSPSWEESFITQPRYLDENIAITVYDQDIGKRAELLGSTNVSLKELDLKKKGDKKEKQSLSLKYKKKSKGKIIVSFEAIDDPISKEEYEKEVERRNTTQENVR